MGSKKSDYLSPNTYKWNDEWEIKWGTFITHVPCRVIAINVETHFECGQCRKTLSFKESKAIRAMAKAQNIGRKVTI
jgi:hypothetical protein